MLNLFYITFNLFYITFKHAQQIDIFFYKVEKQLNFFQKKQVKQNS